MAVSLENVRNSEMKMYKTAKPQSLINHLPQAQVYSALVFTPRILLHLPIKSNNLPCQNIVILYNVLNTFYSNPLPYPLPTTSHRPYSRLNNTYSYSISLLRISTFLILSIPLYPLSLLFYIFTKHFYILDRVNGFMNKVSKNAAIRSVRLLFGL